MYDRSVAHESRRQKMNLPYRKTCQVECALYAYTLRVVDACRLKIRQWRVCPFGGTPEIPNRHPFGLGFAVVGIGPSVIFPDPHRSRPLRCGVSPHGLRQIFYETFFLDKAHMRHFDRYPRSIYLPSASMPWIRSSARSSSTQLSHRPTAGLTPRSARIFFGTSVTLGSTSFTLT